MKNSQEPMCKKANKEKNEEIISFLRMISKTLYENIKKKVKKYLFEKCYSQKSKEVSSFVNKKIVMN